jgi:hypothetical protein
MYYGIIFCLANRGLLSRRKEYGWLNSLFLKNFLANVLFSKGSAYSYGVKINDRAMASQRTLTL